MTRDEPLFKIGNSLDLQIPGNFWDDLNTQLHEIYNTVQVVFGYCITKILHIVPLSLVSVNHLLYWTTALHHDLRDHSRLLYLNYLYLYVVIHQNVFIIIIIIFFHIPKCCSSYSVSEFGH